MENEINQEQMEELQLKLENSEPIPVSMHMSRKSFEFITSSLRILDKEKYRIENGIELTNKHSTLFDFQARVIMSDSSSKVINLREEI